MIIFFIFRHTMPQTPSSDHPAVELYAPETPTQTPITPTRRQEFESAGATPTLKRTNSDGNMLLKVNEKLEFERLKLDFRLKEADNRFLQEELENKERMLAMLTDGLKEVRLDSSNSRLEFLLICRVLCLIGMQVEQSQTEWLTANHDLSYELEKALYQNKLLKAEMARLKEQVMMLELEKQHPHIPSPQRQQPARADS